MTEGKRVSEGKREKERETLFNLWQIEEIQRERKKKTYKETDILGERQREEEY